MIKGIFAIVVFLAHASSYIKLSGSFEDIIFSKVIYAIGQTMVVMFFFYSGYGILESYRKNRIMTRCFSKEESLGR